MQGRTHKPQLDPERCGVCGVCRGACPGQVFEDLVKEEETLRDRLSDAIKGRDAAGPPLCRDVCPLDQDISGYIHCLAQGDPQGALAVILQHNPLPAVLGHVCHHPCESACAGGVFDRPTRIRELKRFAAMAPRPPVSRWQGESKGTVAIVGSGPGGLAAAWALAREGFGVTIYEAMPVAGGLLAWAIPDFRLPRQALEEDLNYILAHGVELRLNSSLSPEGVMDLKKRHRAVILACGAPHPNAVQLPGFDLGGVWQGLDFLREAALERLPQIESPVVVIGGGNAAMDSARLALRLGFQVTLIYRRDRDQMPAYEEEVGAAEAEGLKMVFRAQPVSLEGTGTDQVDRVRLVDTLPGDVGEDGRKQFAPLDGTEYETPAKTVILALGQQSEAGSWAAGLGLDRLTPNAAGRIAPGFYAVGDLTTGPATVVEAMAGGIAAAKDIIAEERS